MSKSDVQEKTSAINKKKHVSFEAKRARYGYMFIAPWLIGVVAFFVIPFFQAVLYVFNDVKLAGGVQYEFVGLKNLKAIFTGTESASYIQNILQSAVYSLPKIFMVVVFSTFVALTLKEKFVGRTIMRAIFFLPVIIASGVVIQILTSKVGLASASTGSDTPQYMFQAPDLMDLLLSLGIPERAESFIASMISNVFQLTWMSGVQILLLLAAINNVPASSYEVADMEGATAWEKFWKITFPMISPTLLVSLNYTIIDSFTDYSNLVMQDILKFFHDGNYSMSTTEGFVYFLMVLVVVGIINAIFARRVFYAVD